MLKFVGQFAGADFYLAISKMAVNNPSAVFSKFWWVSGTDYPSDG